MKDLSAKVIANVTRKKGTAVGLPLHGWSTESDDATQTGNDIVAWMDIRANGEHKNDPRSAPTFAKFLWSSRSICSGLEDEHKFHCQSLHEAFRSKSPCGTCGHGQSQTSNIPETSGCVPSEENGNSNRMRVSQDGLQSITSKRRNSLLSQTGFSSPDTVAGSSFSCALNRHSLRSRELCLWRQDSGASKLKRLLTIAQREHSRTDSFFNSSEYNRDNKFSDYCHDLGERGVYGVAELDKCTAGDGWWTRNSSPFDEGSGYTRDGNESDIDFLRAGSLSGNCSPSKCEREEELPTRKFSYTQKQPGDYKEYSAEQSETPLEGETSPFITSLQRYKASSTAPFIKESSKTLKPILQSITYLNGANQSIVSLGHDNRRKLRLWKDKQSGKLGSLCNIRGKPASLNDMHGRNNGKPACLNDLHSRSYGNMSDMTNTSNNTSCISLYLPDNHLADCQPRLPASILKYISTDNVPNTMGNVSPMRPPGSQTRVPQTNQSDQTSIAYFPIVDLLPSSPDVTFRNSFPTKSNRSVTTDLLLSASSDALISAGHITGNDLLIHANNAFPDCTPHATMSTANDVNRDVHNGAPAFHPFKNRTPLQRARDVTHLRLHGQNRDSPLKSHVTRNEIWDTPLTDKIAEHKAIKAFQNGRSNSDLSKLAGMKGNPLHRKTDFLTKPQEEILRRRALSELLNVK